MHKTGTNAVVVKQDALHMVPGMTMQFNSNGKAWVMGYLW